MKRVFQELILIPFLLIACQPSQVINTSTPTPNPTLTPLFFSTKTATPTFQASTKHIELPDWVKDTDINVFALSYKDEPYTRPSKIKFVNPKNGDMSIVQLPREYYYHYWRDKEHIVFLHEGYCNETPMFISELEISEGTLQEYKTIDYPEKIQGCYDFSDSSEDLVRINTEIAEKTFEIFNSLTNTFILLTNPNDGVNDITYEISDEGLYIAVIQLRGKYEDSEIWNPRLFGDQISIYELNTKRLILQFTEDNDISLQISFLDNHKLVYIRENTPCLILISSLSKKCIHSISQKFPNDAIVLGKPLLYSEKLSFIHFNYETPHGGYCQYDLLLGTINCPTDKFESLSNQNILSYSFSSNEKFLLIMYDSKGCPQPWCDYAAGPKLALINIDKNQIYELGNTNISQFNQPLDLYYYPPWRP